jgi:hypothetical protein
MEKRGKEIRVDRREGGREGWVNRKREIVDG